MIPASRAGFVVAVVPLLRWLMFVIAFRRTQHDLALTVPVWDRQGLQDHVEPIAVLVGERGPMVETFPRCQ